MDFQDDYQAPPPAQPAPQPAPPAAAAAPPTSAKRTSSGDVKPNSNPPTTTVYYGSPAPAGLPVPSTSGSSAPPAPAPTSKNARRRQKLKARRKLSEVYICVLDTNVLLDDLNGIKTMVNNCNNKSKAGGGGGSLVHKVIIPMVVLQELDGIKSDKSRAKHQTAQSAAKFLNAQLIIPNGFVKGEPDKNPATRMSEHTFQVLGNDDRIVECCLRLRELHSDKTVILLSHDINLRNKALTLNIEATVMDDFIGRLKASAMKAPPPPPERPTSNETSQPMELEMAFEPAPPAPTAGEPTQKRLKENPKVPPPPPPPPPTPPAKPAPKVVPKKPAPVAQSNSKPYQK
ncbi:PREDICTED: formin-like protein 5, partial [Rhagoletis zephyria]|uniref:formin-like protein 5 n=1 Tax=Rhagoletis zephyria TaxID=28612 RepID=UPI0008113798